MGEVMQSVQLARSCNLSNLLRRVTLVAVEPSFPILFWRRGCAHLPIGHIGSRGRLERLAGPFYLLDCVFCQFGPISLFI